MLAPICLSESMPFTSPDAEKINFDLQHCEQPQVLSVIHSTRHLA